MLSTIAPRHDRPRPRDTVTADSSQHTLQSFCRSILTQPNHHSASNVNLQLRLTATQHRIRGHNVRGENVRSENIRSENIRSENIHGENIRSENIRSENIRSENIRSENIHGDKARRKGGF